MNLPPPSTHTCVPLPCENINVRAKEGGREGWREGRREDGRKGGREGEGEGRE